MTEFNPFAGAFQIAADIRAKKTTARDALEAYLERTERFNPDLNAIIFSDPDGARQRADDLDAMAARDEWARPLHGVPMTIKESYNVAGMPTTWGVPSLKDNYAESNALSVDRLNAVCCARSNCCNVARRSSFTASATWDSTAAGVPGRVLYLNE